MSEFIKGKYKKNIYSSENGYIIGLFKVEDSSVSLKEYISKTISFTGYFHELNDMDTYIFTGEMINHEKYGMQFQVDSYERCKIEDKDSMVIFLSSDIFKGIGEAKAKKIVSTLGKDTLTTILNNPSNLILIPGVSEKDSKILHDSLVEYEESYDIIIKITDIGFSTKEAMMIYNKYKSSSLEVINNNLYKIVEDVEKISFRRVDYIAINNGILKDDLNRVAESIIYIMNEISNSLGHSYYYLEEIEALLPKILGIAITSDLLDNAINKLIMDSRLVKIDDKYYTKIMYDAEVFIVNRINILNHSSDNKLDNIDLYIKRLEEYFGIDYNIDQEEAIKNSYLKNFLIITGGPGTGKTTIMKAIVELYKEANKLSYNDLKKQVALLAPTGRAAKRMSETTNLPSYTIHRFLKWNKDTNKFQINEYNKSDVSFVLVDESSMIDTYLFSSLLKGLSVNTKIILVGDVFQLPSVGPGQVLHDLISSEKLNVCSLNTLYRQEEGSNIINLAYCIKNGEMNFSLFNKTVDLTFLECNSNLVLEKIAEIAELYLDVSYKEFQVLAPMYKTNCGIDNINIKLQDLFNKKSASKKEILIGEELYRENDKVIQLTNMPDDNVYNGDIGIIKKIKLRPKKEIYIDFDDNLVKYTQANFSNFKKAYAISIHKAQGSEFDIVIIPLVKSFNKMLYRKLIYTAVTRCKKNLFLIGEKEALSLAINNINTDVRRTSIKKFLVDGIK